MINIFTILLIIVFIIFIRNKNKENFISISPNDKMFELSKQNKINFNYKIIPPNPTIAELNQTILPIEKQFLKFRCLVSFYCPFYFFNCFFCTRNTPKIIKTDIVFFFVFFDTIFIIFANIRYV